MAKNKDYVVHVQSSTFKELLTAQQDTLGTLKSMKDIMEGLTVLKADRAKPVASEVNPEVKKLEEENIRLRRKLNSLHNDEIKTLKERLKLQDEEAESISNIAKNMKLFYSPLERFRMGLEKMKSSFTEGGGIRGALLKTFNIGGILNKSIEREKFIRTQKTLGSEKSREELKKDFAGAQSSSKQLRKTESEIEQFKKTTGLSESDMAKTVGGRKLLDKRKAQAEEYAKYDERAKLVRHGEPTIKPSMGGLAAEQVTKKSPTQEFADKGQAEEQDMENARLVGEQTVLLTKIEENTRGASPDQKAKPQEEEGGGLLGKLMGGGGMGKALGALKQFGVGIVFVAGALWVASKAFQNFAEVAWEDVGKGLVALGGLVLAAIGLDKVKGNILAGSAALGVLALATWGIGAALKTFSDLDWETIGKGMVAIGGLGVIGAIAGAAAAPIALGAGALGLLGGALWIIGEAMQAVGKGFSDMNEGLEKLSQLDGDNLLKVGAGLGAVAAGLLAFSAAQVAAGIGNIVTGLLSIVSGKSPIDQLKELAQFGPNLEKAGVGVEKLGNGLKSFSSIDTEKIKAIAALPTEKIAAMGAAMGNAGTVYNRSGENAGAVVGGGGNTQTNVVNAPVNNVTKQTQIIRAPIRNRDSTVHEYLRTRYAPA